MIADENLCCTLGLGWRRFGHLLAEFGIEFIVVGTFDLNFLQVRGVSLDADTLARLGKDRHDGVIGKDQIENGGMLAGHFVGEAPALDMYGVEPVDRSVLGIDIELALVDVQQMPLYLEMAAVDTAGRQ